MISGPMRGLWFSHVLERTSTLDIPSWVTASSHLAQINRQHNDNMNTKLLENIYYNIIHLLLFLFFMEGMSMQHTVFRWSKVVQETVSWGRGEGRW